MKKLVNTTENAFADRSIMLSEIEEFFRQNYEKEVRVSIRAEKVRNSIVMKNEDILKKQKKQAK
jgi:hypothetical protein